MNINTLSTSLIPSYQHCTISPYQQTNIAGWIFNAVLYAVMICLLFYNAGHDSFTGMGLYGMGTTVFVGTCNTLQWKVVYLFNQWDWIKIFLPILSIFGGLAYFSVIAVGMWEYWHEAHVLYSSSFFWFYGFFAVPFFVIYLDLVVQNITFFFFPTREMLYREVEHRETFNDPPLLQIMKVLAGLRLIKPLTTNEKEGADVSTHLENGGEKEGTKLHPQEDSDIRNNNNNR